jgi:hypothetical protein
LMVSWPTSRASVRVKLRAPAILEPGAVLRT